MDGLKPTRDVAIVIPVAGDTEALGELLRHLESLDAAPREIIVVCASRDALLAELVARHGCRLIETEPNRGAQLDCGARAASAAVLWFVHTTARFDADALDAVWAACERGAESGCFRFEFQGPPRPLKRLITGLVALRIRLGGMAYGDQALFATREAYLAAGGFTHDPLFDEVRLVKRLRSRGSFGPLGRPVYVATSKWERDGWIKRSLRNRWLALCHAVGVPAKALNLAYRQTARRRRGETSR
jgi:hypothetical protein